MCAACRPYQSSNKVSLYDTRYLWTVSPQPWPLIMLIFHKRQRFILTGVCGNCIILFIISYFIYMGDDGLWQR